MKPSVCKNFVSPSRCKNSQAQLGQKAQALPTLKPPGLWGPSAPSPSLTQQTAHALSLAPSSLQSLGHPGHLSCPSDGFIPGVSPGAAQGGGKESHGGEGKMKKLLRQGTGREGDTEVTH